MVQIKWEQSQNVNSLIVSFDTVLKLESRKKEGYPPFKTSKTFSKKSLADEWIRKTEAEIELNPEKMLNPASEFKCKTLAEFVDRYLDDADSFARTKTGALKFIASLEISEKNIYSLIRFTSS